MNLPILKTTTSAISEMTDANELADIYRQAEALVRLIIDDYETQTQIAKRRNHALRRIGQIRAEIGKSDDRMSTTEFDTSLGLTSRDVEKARSLAAMSDMDFEHRENNTGAVLFRGTPYGRRLEKDNNAVIAARKARREARAEERRELYSGPTPRSVMPDTLEATIERPAPRSEPAPLPKVTVTDVTPVEEGSFDERDVKQWFWRVENLLHNHPFHDVPSDQRQQCWDDLDGLMARIADIQKELQHG